MFFSRGYLKQKSSNTARDIHKVPPLSRVDSKKSNPIKSSTGFASKADYKLNFSDSRAPNFYLKKCKSLVKKSTNLLSLFETHITDNERGRKLISDNRDDSEKQALLYNKTKQR